MEFHDIETVEDVNLRGNILRLGPSNSTVYIHLVARVSSSATCEDYPQGYRTRSDQSATQLLLQLDARCVLILQGISEPTCKYINKTEVLIRIRSRGGRQVQS
eukprot:scaffold2582_cov162-Ochromonas_danica.AAC.24